MVDKAIKEGEEQTTPAEAPTVEEVKPQAPGEPDKTAAQPEGGTEGEGNIEIGEPDEKRPSRAERRIQDLVEKLKGKEAGQDTGDFMSQGEVPMPEYTQGLPWQEPPNPFKDLEGTVDTDELKEKMDRYIAAMTDLRVRQVLGRKEQEDAYRKAVGEWVGDLEQTIRENPELQKNSPEYNAELNSALMDLVEKTNFTPDGQPVPTIKTSELLGRIKKALETERSKAQSEVSVSIAKKISEEAVRPSPTKGKEGYTVEDLRQMMFKNPKRVAQILKESLPTAEE